MAGPDARPSELPGELPIELSKAPADDPLVIVVGGDALALGTARELCRLHGHRVVVLWPQDAEFARAVDATGARAVVGRPNSSEALERAGVGEAVTIMALSPDDRLNLQAALRARDTNPRIRIVLRQFNRTLARKIEQNLPDCSVLSLAWLSAATYATAALDPSCFRGVQFPEAGGPLTGFATRLAEGDDIAGRRVGDIERLLVARVIAVDADTAITDERIVARGERLTIFGETIRLAATSPRRQVDRPRQALRGRWRALWRRPLHRRHPMDSILGRLALIAFGFFVVGMWYFHNAFHSDWLSAAFFVLTTMTTNGFTSDLTPNLSHPYDIVAAMLLMLAGIVLSGIFIASGTALLTRVQWIRMQGLRRIRRRGHIIVCGAGSIGSGVIDLLLSFDRPLVVVEQTPDPAMVERARDQGFDLLTGDASRDATLDLCSLATAHTLIALTNVDTLNLEIALGARARNPDLPIVLRIAEAGFATSIARHFAVETTFSAEALATPAFAGLSRLSGARGRVAFAGQEFAIAEIAIGAEGPEATPLPNGILLAIGREDDFMLARDATALAPGDRVLMLVPLAPFHDGSDTFRAAVDRAYRH